MNSHSIVESFMEGKAKYQTISDIFADLHSSGTNQKTVQFVDEIGAQGTQAFKHEQRAITGSEHQWTP